MFEIVSICPKNEGKSVKIMDKIKLNVSLWLR